MTQKKRADFILGKNFDIIILERKNRKGGKITVTPNVYYALKNRQSDDNPIAIMEQQRRNVRREMLEQLVQQTEGQKFAKELSESIAKELKKALDKTFKDFK